MNSTTIDKITLINQKFYSVNAVTFEKTRLRSWLGWNQLLPLIEPNKSIRAVDIGCGNGRWLSFLHDKALPIESAVGIDLDLYMLDQAKRTFPDTNKFRFYQGDCVRNLDGCKNHFGDTNLITSFGLWHHIPSQQLRFDNLVTLLHCLVKGGILIINFWQFADNRYFVNKLIRPGEICDTLDLPLNEFEPGDYFLGNKETDTIRYCHSYSDEEVNSIATQLGVRYQLVKGEGNDQLNSYLLLYAD